MKSYKHQQIIIDEDPKQTLFALGTGSGKSYIALSLAKGKTLIICPKTLKEDGAWGRQLSKMDKVLDITVFSKETFRRDAHLLPRFDTVIVDEADTCLGATPNLHWVKKQAVVKTSQLYDELSSFVKRTNPERLYLLTATITRSPMTVWAAGTLLGRNWDFYKWRNTFYFRLNMPGREVWRAKDDSATKDRLAKAVHSIGYTGRLEDYFDVPLQTFKTVFVDLSTSQKERIKELRFEYPDPLVLLGKKHQVENGILIGDEFRKTEYFDNEKIEKIKDYALEFPKMIIFAKFIAQIEQIEKAMKDLGKKTFVLTGQVKGRGEIIAEANKCEDYVFICQSQISAGWELSSCPVMIFASLSYSITDYLQSVGRIQRANNLKKNLYIHLVARGGIDTAVFNAIETKTDFNERIFLDL